MINLISEEIDEIKDPSIFFLLGSYIQEINTRNKILEEASGKLTDYFKSAACIIMSKYKYLKLFYCKRKLAYIWKKILFFNCRNFRIIINDIKV